MKFTASIATRETDEILREEASNAGADAWRSGKLPTDCPHNPNSLVYKWWMEGYNSLGKRHESTFPKEPI